MFEKEDFLEKTRAAREERSRLIQINNAASKIQAKWRGYSAKNKYRLRIL